MLFCFGWNEFPDKSSRSVQEGQGQRPGVGDLSRRRGDLVLFLCYALRVPMKAGCTYGTSQDDLEPCGEMKGAPDFMRRV